MQQKLPYSLCEMVDAILWIAASGQPMAEPAGKLSLMAEGVLVFPEMTSRWHLRETQLALAIRERQRVKKENSPSWLYIDSQSIKVAPFVSQQTGINGNKKVNGRKRHVVTNTLGLVWGVVVQAANQADGATDGQLPAPHEEDTSR